MAEVALLSPHQMLYIGVADITKVEDLSPDAGKLGCLVHTSSGGAQVLEGFTRERVEAIREAVKA